MNFLKIQKLHKAYRKMLLISYHSLAYSSARGKMRRPLQDEPLRMHAATASSLIKSESWMRQDDHTNLFAKSRK